MFSLRVFSQHMWRRRFPQLSHNARTLIIIDTYVLFLFTISFYPVSRVKCDKYDVIKRETSQSKNCSIGCIRKVPERWWRLASVVRMSVLVFVCVSGGNGQEPSAEKRRKRNEFFIDKNSIRERSDSVCYWSSSGKRWKSRGPCPAQEIPIDPRNGRSAIVLILPPSYILYPRGVSSLYPTRRFLRG